MGVGMETVSERLAALQQMDRTELADAWQSGFRCPAPRGSRAELLRQALGWQAQVSAAGVDLSRLRRRVQRVSSPPVSPGTRLIRQWQGSTHQVTVLAEGFEYRGTVYKSLSVIARHITGTRWSGPKFFGLR